MSVEKIRLVKYLGSEDRKTIEFSILHIENAPIGNLMGDDNTLKTWYKKNVVLQTELSSLKTRLDIVRGESYWDIKQKEGEALKEDPDLMDYKSRDDRISAMILANPEIKDLQVMNKRYEALSEYVERLIWSLRNTLDLIKK